MLFHVAKKNMLSFLNHILGILRVLFRYYSQMATIIMSNVPGPTVPLYFAGHKIKQVIAWVPQSGSVGLGVSIVSYAGNFRVIAHFIFLDKPIILSKPRLLGYSVALSVCMMQFTTPRIFVTGLLLLFYEEFIHLDWVLRRRRACDRPPVYCQRNRN